MFKRSSFCKADSDLCVDVHLPETDGQPVIVRNSKNPGVMVAFTVEEWREFIAGAKANEFDIPELPVLTVELLS